MKRGIQWFVIWQKVTCTMNGDKNAGCQGWREKEWGSDRRVLGNTHRMKIKGRKLPSQNSLKSESICEMWNTGVMGVRYTKFALKQW